MKTCSCILLLSLALSHAVLNAQQPSLSSDVYSSISWVGQYPAKNATRMSFFQKIDELVFGVRPDLINTPVCAIKDQDGALWILNKGNGKISKVFDSKVEEINRKHYQKFPSLVSACEIPSKGVLFSDSFLNALFLISKEGKINRISTSDSLRQPTGIAYSRLNDQIWIIETAAHKVSIYSSSGDLIKSIGGRGTETGKFNFPTHIWIDASGKAYIVDALNFRIQIFSSAGEFLSSFGGQGNASGFFARPKGISTDSKGNIYVADALFNAIQVFNQEGELLHYFGSQGSQAEQFWMPSGLFIDDKDYIYVSDSYNNRVQQFEYLKRE